ncbi:MAG: lysophospholipid acyltransferase family protein [Cyclobacteriaceae bacterium]
MWKLVKKGFHILYAVYAFIIFCLLFIIFLPAFLVPIYIPSKHSWVGSINRIWAYCFFTLIFIPITVEMRFRPAKGRRYIFCPNHFSYLDIPAMGLNPVNAIFVGKNDMEKIPLFGYMYKKLHITVNRMSVKSRYETLIRAGEAIDGGKSLTIFPEGGIITEEPPVMARFKDGAFRTAIEKQIEIVPVTIPYNWIILPDSTFLPIRHRMKVIFHEPIPTAGMTLAETGTLRENTYRIIEEELKNQMHEDR